MVQKNVRMEGEDGGGRKMTRENDEQRMTRMFCHVLVGKKKKIVSFIEDSIKLNLISDIASSTINRV